MTCPVVKYLNNSNSLNYINTEQVTTRKKIVYTDLNHIDKSTVAALLFFL